MKKIIYQTKSSEIYKAHRNRDLSTFIQGGTFYDMQLASALSKNYNFEINYLKMTGWSKYINTVKFYFYQADAHYFIQDSFMVGLAKKNKSGKTIGLIHHIDYTLKDKGPKWKWFINRLEKRLLTLDMVVVVSKYWKEYVEKIGCKNVKVIYNPFIIDQFNIGKEEINNFIGKFKIPGGKPIVYIGNARKQKGVIEVFQALKDEKYTLVMSGPADKDIDLPILRFDLKYRDYLTLLTLCDVVITMSVMPEGWNRTAHEAMLCHTPVIGSGSGGMRELLEGGKQIISGNYHELPKLISRALSKKEELVEAGFGFAKQFDIRRFEISWLSLLQEMDNS